MGQGDGTAREALRLIEEGLAHQGRGEIEDAIRCYRESLDLHSTAEGYTYLGWAVSMQGDYQNAIAHCVSAINLDPDFGNPYNDIGVYMMELGRQDDAIPFLRKAKVAPRYEPRHYPSINLAKIYERKGLWDEAIQELDEALGRKPGDQTSLLLKGRIIRLSN